MLYFIIIILHRMFINIIIFIIVLHRMFINIITLYLGAYFYLLSLPTAMFLISINPIHYSVCHWIHAVFMRSNPVLDKNLLYFSVAPLYYTFCCRRYLWTSKTKLQKGILMPMHGLPWIAFSFQHAQEITYNYRITDTKEACSRKYLALQNYCYYGSM
jgi:hypothetical protein